MPELVLASSSPRRALLLGSAGFTFNQVFPEVEETPLDDESPEYRLVRLARAKEAAAMALDRLGLDDVISIGAYNHKVDVLVSATRARNALLEHADEARLSKRLSTLRSDVPLPREL